MVNIYNWSYQIENNFVRIIYVPELKKFLQSSIKNFCGVVMNTKMQDNELIIRFKDSKTVENFILAILEKYPNSFHLENLWDICKSSNSSLSFTSICDGNNSISELSKLANSLFTDCQVISLLTTNEITDIKINIDSSICCFTFDINFSSSDEAKIFLKEFNHFKV